MKGVKPRVKKLLKFQPHLRDDDNKLIANIWYYDTNNVENMSAMEFLAVFSSGQLTSPESIRRMRQKLQEENIDLQGKNYKARFQEEVKIRKEIVK